MKSLNCVLRRSPEMDAAQLLITHQSAITIGFHRSTAFVRAAGLYIKTHPERWYPSHLI